MKESFGEHLSRPSGRTVQAAHLERGQMSLDHGERITEVTPQAGQSVLVTLESGQKIILDYTDELTVAD